MHKYALSDSNVADYQYYHRLSAHVSTVNTDTNTPRHNEIFSDAVA